MSADSAAIRFMRRALQLAQQGWGFVHPNPLVGAVVVRDGVIVGEGYHRLYGGPHAEVTALRAAGAAARGATLYVTLEPCAHHGKTAPCTDAIIDAGIAAVNYATEDPNRTAGGGAARLRAAGIQASAGLLRTQARTLNAPFFHVHEQGAPFVALKLALSLDGRIATRPGERTAITGPDASREVHRLRAGFDAIMIGSGTAAVDDPLLTVRDVTCRTPPVRIVVDTDAALAHGARLVQSMDRAPLWMLAAHDAPAARVQALSALGVRVIGADRAAHGVELRSGLAALAAAGVHTIFAEGGSALANSLLAQQLVQRLYLFVAPHFLGRDGVPAFTLADAQTGWRCSQLRRFGDDALLLLERTEVQ